LPAGSRKHNDVPPADQVISFSTAMSGGGARGEKTGAGDDYAGAREASKAQKVPDAFFSIKQIRTRQCHSDLSPFHPLDNRGLIDKPAPNCSPGCAPVPGERE
jgi:hypothetical protein